VRQVSIAEILTLDDYSFKPLFNKKDSVESFVEADEDKKLNL
jgi:hypothetical protein